MFDSTVHITRTAVSVCGSFNELFTLPLSENLFVDYCDGRKGGRSGGVRKELALMTSIDHRSKSCMIRDAKRKLNDNDPISQR